MSTRPVHMVPDDLAGRLDLLARLLRLTVGSDEIRAASQVPKVAQVRERVRCALEDVLEARVAYAESLGREVTRNGRG